MTPVIASGSVTCISGKSEDTSRLIMSSSHQMSISCTPYFKQDAEKAWVTQDSLTSVKLYFNPDHGLTLEDIAQTIEQFVHTMPGYSTQVASCTVASIAIRGEHYSKDSLMSGHMAADKFHDGEQFTVRVDQRVGTGCCAIL